MPTPISKTKWTSQNIDNMSWDEDMKVRVTEIIGADGVLKNPATEVKQDDIISAIGTEWTSNLGIDKSDATNYYFGYTQIGTTNWRIKRMNKTTYAIDWATGTTDPATNYTNRTSLTYSITI